MLIEQYRMCLSISKPTSDILSKGLLQTHHSTLRSYTEAKQLISFFKAGLGGGYHNWDLFGVDTSGQDTETGTLVQSQQFRQTTSLVNSNKADFLDNLVITEPITTDGKKHKAGITKRGQRGTTAHEMQTLRAVFLVKGLLAHDAPELNMPKVTPANTMVHAPYTG
ncbi:hypothetical protein E4T42_03198 [Aureobasidium subglaciale]|nr:hypothetical protein E4T42_03198 [Aureobasidium subglaciale]